MPVYNIFTPLDSVIQQLYHIGFEKENYDQNFIVCIKVLFIVFMFQMYSKALTSLPICHPPLLHFS
jgi:hypothetical protein